MSKLTQLLSDLGQIESIERDKAIKLLTKIFNNILSYPSEQKYGDLNFKRICIKFEKCTPAINILNHVGFKQSNDKKRLKWINNNDNLNVLKNVIHALQQQPNSASKKDDKNTEKTFINDIKLYGITNENESEFIPDLNFNIVDMTNTVENCRQFIYPTNVAVNNAEYICKLYECPCLAVITNALQMAILNQNEQKIDINYNKVDLLNDFNHLLFYHSNEFEYIYNKLIAQINNNKPCNLLKCLMMKRNQRNRSEITENENLLNKLYLNNNN
eukprot:174020_1